MAVRFRYLTGLKRRIFRNARLTGSWDGAGRFSQVWSEAPMSPGTADDGCPCFTATVQLDEAELGTRFRWGVRLDGPGGANVWGIPIEVNDMRSAERLREFELTAAPESRRQDFYFTYARRLGAPDRRQLRRLGGLLRLFQQRRPLCRGGQRDHLR